MKVAPTGYAEGPFIHMSHVQSDASATPRSSLAFCSFRAAPVGALRRDLQGILTVLEGMQRSGRFRALTGDEAGAVAQLLAEMGRVAAFGKFLMAAASEQVCRLPGPVPAATSAEDLSALELRECNT